MCALFNVIVMMLLNPAPYPEVLLFAFFRRRRGGGEAQEPRRSTARGRGPGGGRAADLGSQTRVSRPFEYQERRLMVRLQDDWLKLSENRDLLL